MSWAIVVRYWPHLLVLGILASVVLYISEGRYDSGYLSGDEAGFKRGALAAHALRDAQELALRAEYRAEREQQQKEASEHAREVESRTGAAIASSGRLVEATEVRAARERDRLLARLRDLQARAAGPAPADRVPEGPGGGVQPGLSPGLLPGWGEEVLGLLVSAETLNAWYAHCTRAYRAIAR